MRFDLAILAGLAALAVPRASQAAMLLVSASLWGLASMSPTVPRGAWTLARKGELCRRTDYLQASQVTAAILSSVFVIFSLFPLGLYWLSVVAPWLIPAGVAIASVAFLAWIARRA